MSTFNEDDHPREPEGAPDSKGGEFTTRISHGSKFEKIKKLVKSLEEPDGGFTYNPVTGSEPKEGFAVSVFEGKSWAINAKELSFVKLAQYVDKHRETLKLKGNYFGGWHNPASGMIFFDVSRVVRIHGDARRLAKEHDQIAYFDLARGRSITVNKDAKSGGAVGGSP